MSRLNNPKFLIGNWPLNNHADDVSGYGNNGTWSGTEAYQTNTFGKSNAYMDGGEYILNSYGALSGKTWTVSFLVRFDTTSIKTTTSLVSQHADGVTGRMLMAYSNSTNTIRVQEEGTTRTACALTPVIGNTYHLIFVMDAGKGTIYINGISQTLTTDGTYASNIPSVPNCIGRYNSGADTANDFHGLIGDIKCFNIGLTGDEAEQLYQDSQIVPKQTKVSFPKPQRTPYQNGNLVGSWGYNNGLGFKDSSGQGNDTTPIDMVLGENGGFKGNGTSSYLNNTANLVNFSSETQGTISVWLRETGSYDYVLCCSDLSYIGQNLVLNMDVLTPKFDIFTVGGGNIATVTSSVVPTSGEWYHLVITGSSSTTPKMYVNGIDVSTSASGAGWFADVPNLDWMSFGVRNLSSGLAGYWTGDMREMSIHNTILTPAEIKMIYNQGVPSDSENLVLDVLDGTEDLSVNKISLTVSNCIVGKEMDFTNGGITWSSQTFTNYGYWYESSNQWKYYFYDGTDTYTNGVLTGSMPVNISATGFSGVTAKMKDIKLFNETKSVDWIKNYYLKTRKYY